MAPLVRIASAKQPGDVEALARLLVDAVDGGASVSFMAPLSLERAEAFWTSCLADPATVVVVAEDAGEVVGTVTLHLVQIENQPHRGEIAKVLVLRSARRRGIATTLMRAVEAEAVARGRTLLVLDTVSDSDADRLYRRLGWIPVGSIPNYALFPDGRPCPTTVFYRDLS
jgi:GNAT superfamily N-acetyltransferase